MKTLKYIIKTALWSVAVSIVIRIVFGLYSVFGAPVLFLAIFLGLCTAHSLSTSGIASFTVGALAHVLLVTGFYVVFDVTDLFRMLALDSADFFAKIAGVPDGRVNILWCILFVMPLYFASFVLSAGVISSIKERRRLRIIEAEEVAETDEAA